MNVRSVFYGSLAVAVTALAAAGCSHKRITDTPEFAALNDRQKSVVRLMDSYNCFDCHELYGLGKGKNLDHVGAKRSEEWIEAKIRDPKKTNPRSKMPKLDMPEANRKVIAEHLAGLK